MQLRQIALRLDRICGHSDCPGLRFESPGWGPDPGPLSGRSSTILEMPRNPRNWALGLSAILAQSCELWINCRFKSILTAIYTIKVNCDDIAKPRWIARGSTGLHQNPGKSTNCNQTSPIAPQLASDRDLSGVRTRSPKTLAMPAQSFAILGILVERVLGLFAILAQSSGLWIDCKYNAILTQFRPIGSGLRPTATHRPRIAPNWTEAQSTQNARTAILTVIFTIKFNCGEIAKSRRIVRGLKGFHQNLGKSTNCEKTSPIAPRIGIHSQSVRDQSAVHPKPWQCRHNLLQSWGLQRNCRFKAIRLQSTSINTVELDCDWIAKVQRIARQSTRLNRNPW